MSSSSELSRMQAIIAIILESEQTFQYFSRYAVNCWNCLKFDAIKAQDACTNQQITDSMEHSSTVYNRYM